MYFGKTKSACSVVFKNRSLTNGCGDMYTQLVLSQGARGHEITAVQFIHIFKKMQLQCCHSGVLCCLPKVHKMRTRRSQLETLRGARGHETSLCVASVASRCGASPRALSQRSKYVMVPTTVDTHVRQTPMSVASGTRRVCDGWPIGFHDVVTVWNRAG